MHLTVITATHQRPAQLALCLRQFQQQSVGGLAVEHLIVSDSVDPTARFLCRRAGARYCELEQPGGCAGAAAKDRGVQLARGDYVCFWDDDNLYEPHALTTLYAAAVDAEIGIVQTRHRLRKSVGMVTLPRRWEGTFHFGDLDTMCVCVRKSLALQELWGDGCTDIGTDFRWLQKLQRHRPRIRFVPIVIGMHL
ncbi:glycosyltransferase family 2 protein [Planctomicrobium sp. SH664]|uniref:glycosyltransferase family 2 protein n=1 Tax=Planctomicrobium sp. SH664 TaxID=3448125 RepID=UPI003F5C6E80